MFISEKYTVLTFKRYKCFKCIENESVYNQTEGWQFKRPLHYGMFVQITNIKFVCSTQRRIIHRVVITDASAPFSTSFGLFYGV